MPAAPQIDYDALAKQHGALSSTPDYDALAKAHGAVSSEPAQSGDQRGFWESLVDKINPVPAIKEWLNRPSQVGAAMDALHVTREAAMRNPANKGKLPGQWVSSPETELTPEEKGIAENGFNAHLPVAEGNLVSELGSPAVEATGQARVGNLKGAAGTLTGAYVIPAATAALVPKVVAAAPVVAAKVVAAAPVVADATKATGAGIKAAVPPLASGAAMVAGGEALAHIPGMEWPARIGMGYPGVRMMAGGVKKGLSTALQDFAKRRAAAADAADAVDQAKQTLVDHIKGTAGEAAAQPLPAERQLPAASEPNPSAIPMGPATPPETPATTAPLPDTSGPIPTDPVTGRPLEMGPAPSRAIALSNTAPTPPPTAQIVSLDEIAQSLAQKPFSKLTAPEQATVQKIHADIHGSPITEPEAPPTPAPEVREPDWWKTPEEKAAGQSQPAAYKPTYTPEQQAVVDQTNKHLADIEASAPAPSIAATPGPQQNAPAPQANAPNNPSPTSRVVIHPGEFAPTKLLSEEGLNTYATDNGVSVDEARQMLSDDGYQVIGRNQINRALHGIGSELGMDHDTLSDVAKIQFRVKSMTQLSQEDMLSLYENLQNKRSASQPLIGKGDLPEAIKAQNSAGETKVSPAEPPSSLPEPERSFSSTQVQLPKQFNTAFKAATHRVPDTELAEDGRETEPHITVKYGLHDEDPTGVKSALADEGPVKATIGKVSVFPAMEASAQRGGSQYDVVKLDVNSPDLERLNGKIATLPHTDTHPVYQPHITLAYVKPGEGAKYVGQNVPGLTGKNVTFDSLRFSGKDENTTDIPLKPTAARVPGGQQNAPTPVPTILQNNPKALAAAQALKAELEKPPVEIPKSDFPLTARQRAVETRFNKQIAEDPEGAMEEYRKRFGNVLNADNAKELSADYMKDRSVNAVPVHEGASWLTKEMYKDELSHPAPPGKENEVLFTAGGAGAGKTTAIEGSAFAKSVMNKAQIVFDGTLRPAASAMGKIDQALKAGKDAIVLYVYRDPVESFTGGVLKRAASQEQEFGSGRTVPIDEFVAQHTSIGDSMQALAEKYKDNPNFHMEVVDNSHGVGKSRIVKLGDLPAAPEPKALREQLIGVLNEAYRDGRISRKIYDATLKGGGKGEKGI